MATGTTEPRREGATVTTSPPMAAAWPSDPAGAGDPLRVEWAASLARRIADNVRCVVRGHDLAVDLVTAAVGRMTHGYEREFKTGALEPQQLLGDEGFRQSRITLQHDDDPFRHCGRQFVPSISVKRACVR